MRGFALVLLALPLLMGAPACPPNPNPTPMPTPSPTPTPTPAPGHVCMVGEEFCQCWFLTPGSDVWLEAQCPEGQTCAPDRKSCIAPTPPSCPETCPPGQECTDPAVGCVVKPTPPPTTGACPWKLSQYPGVHLEANTKYWGQGLDHTTLVVGSRQYCTDRGWTDGRSSCQVAVDGDPNKVICEIEFGGGCPRFEFRQGSVQHPCVDDQNDLMSCDHFGDPVTRDDPQTPTTGNTLATLKGFEGEPKVCGLQRIGDKPIAGFFTIAHGFGGEARSCVDGSFSACGPWLAVNH